MERMIICALLISISSFLSGQSTTPHKDFDFWIGEWETTMSLAPNWQETKGKDKVSYLLNGRLIEEIFTKSGGDNPNFQRGYLTYLAREKRWKHTIYDAKWGEYTFYGNKVGDKMILESDPKSTRPGLRRETFHSITKDSFVYLWETSNDGGKSWRAQWKVVYNRLDKRG